MLRNIVKLLRKCFLIQICRGHFAREWFHDTDLNIRDKCVIPHVGRSNCETKPKKLDLPTLGSVFKLPYYDLKVMC